MHRCSIASVAPVMVNSNKQPIRELLRFLTSWQMLVIQGGGIAIVALSPNDVLTRCPALREFVYFISRVIPPVEAYQKVSNFPEVSGLYFSVMFCVTPLLTLYAWKTRRYAIEGIEIASKRRPTMWVVAALMSIPFCMSMPLLLYVLANGSEIFPLMPMRSSKTSLAVFGWAAAGGVAWVLVPHGLCLTVVLTRKLLEQKPREKDDS